MLKRGSDPLVWVHPKSKWIADNTPHHNYNNNSTKIMNNKNIDSQSELFLL